jgi:hypothetical protein
VVVSFPKKWRMRLPSYIFSPGVGVGAAVGVAVGVGVGAGVCACAPAAWSANARLAATEIL